MQTKHHLPHLTKPSPAWLPDLHQPDDDGDPPHERTMNRSILCDLHGEQTGEQTE